MTRESSDNGDRKSLTRVIVLLAVLGALGYLGSNRSSPRVPQASQSRLPNDSTSARLEVPDADANGEESPPDSIRTELHEHRKDVPSDQSPSPQSQGEPLPWSEARASVQRKAREVFENHVASIDHHLSGGWARRITPENVLSRFQITPDDVTADPREIADEVRAELVDLRAEMRWLTDQYSGHLESAVERVLKEEPAHSQSALPPTETVAGGRHGIELKASETGGWNVRYQLFSGDYPELQRLEREIQPLMIECNRRALRIIGTHRKKHRD